ncbi:MAG: hypothetical protein ACHQJD_00280 [Thermoanaerobaculia bacterium]
MSSETRSRPSASTGTIEDGPVDPARASHLFETAGLDPALLPALGARYSEGGVVVVGGLDHLGIIDVR